jgi:hypothetical protein
VNEGEEHIPNERITSIDAYQPYIDAWYAIPLP